MTTEEKQEALKVKIEKILGLAKELQVEIIPKLQANDNGIIPAIGYYDQEKYEVADQPDSEDEASA